MSIVNSGFVPNFNGFCSQLESGLDNKINCDCRDSGGGNFNVSCSTVDEECYRDGNETVCGKVQALVLVEDGIISTVKACSDYSKPRDLPEICVSFALKQNSDKNDRVVSCEASLDGTRCSCDLCDEEGVDIDCTNAASWARTSTCQPIRSVYEFMPEFLGMPMSDGPSLLMSSLSALLVLGTMAWSLL